ncbi:MAG: hypothetical protein JO189_22945 [Deltaproteobacteria bacterium]|nr:hypothetical protein [Deltaproteobacteria bacterium]
MRNKLLVEQITGRLCASILLAVAFFSQSTLALAGSSRFGEIVSSDQSVAQSVIIPTAPPAGFAPTAASDADLEYYGYPPRPDEQSAPKAYSNWKKMVSAPRGVNPQATQTTISAGPASGVRMGPTLSNGNVSVSSNNWSGYAITAANGTWTHNNNYVFQQFFVPVAQPAFGVCNDVPVYSVQWPGFDGAFISGDVLQAGALEGAQCSSSGRATLYTAWYEWYPFSMTFVSVPAVQPGDLLGVEVWYTTTSPHGHAYIVNYTLNTSGSYAFNPPSTTTYLGDSVEWVQERPGVNGGLADLLNYVGDAFNEAEAYNGSYYYPSSTLSGTTTYRILMTCPPWNPSSACTSTKTISSPYLYSPYSLWFYDSLPAY